MRERDPTLPAPAGFTLPGLDDVLPGIRADPPRQHRLDACYYDTPDLRLARAGVSLSFRRAEPGAPEPGAPEPGAPEPGASGPGTPGPAPGRWIVTLPARGDGAAESRDPGRYREHDLAADASEPPAAALDLVRAYARSARVAPVARLVTQRCRVRLGERGGPVVAEVVDDDVTVVRAGREQRRFRELAVARCEGAPPAVLDAILERLRAAGARPPDATPTVVRALGGHALAPPDLVPPAPLGRAARAGDVVRAALTASVARLIASEPHLHLDDDPEAVHDARVATRRLRSDLRTFRPFLDPRWAAGLRTDLRALAGCLGAVRDADVLLADLGRLVARVPPEWTAAAERVLEGLRRERADAHRRLADELRSLHHAVLLDVLVDAATAPQLAPRADRPAREVLPRCVRGPWRRLRAAVRSLPAQPDDAALHRVRILAKQCRYAVEAVAPVAGRSARRLARRLAELQDVLGAQHDAVVARAWLVTTSATLDRDAAYAAGLLGALVEAEEHGRRAEWRHAWDRVRARRPRGWW